jgi:hypothetical protein
MVLFLELRFDIDGSTNLNTGDVVQMRNKLLFNDV